MSNMTFGKLLRIHMSFQNAYRSTGGGNISLRFNWLFGNIVCLIKRYADKTDTKVNQFIQVF